MSNRQPENKTKGHEVSLKRPDGWYSADNEMVTVFAPLIGPYAFSVYHLLKQRSFLDVEKRAISLLGISEALTISKDSAGNALETLKQFYLIEELPATATNKPPRYEVVHAKDALVAHPEIRTWLEASQCKKSEARILKSGRNKKTEDFPQNPQSHPEFRTRVKTKRILKSGRSASEIQDGDGRNSGRSHPEFRMLNKEEVLKDKVQIQDNTPLPPLQGGETNPSEAQEKPRKNYDIVSGIPPIRDILAGMMQDFKGEKSGAAVPDDRSPRQLALIFLDELHEQFARAFSVQKKGIDWEDPLEAWQRCFDHVRVGEVEADGAQWVVILETPRPKDLVVGLVKYRAKVQLAMKQAFGREVQLVPRLEAA